MEKMSAAPLYWQGNAAKTRVIADLLSRKRARGIFGCPII